MQSEDKIHTEQISNDQSFQIDIKNYAGDPEMDQKALNFIRRLGIELQSRRSYMNMKYLQYYNIYRTVFDLRFYNGEAQVYIPELRKAVEQFVSRVKKALFPTDDIFEVEPVDQEMEDESELIYDYMKWIIEKRVKLKEKIDRFLRQLAMYGWSVVECEWEEDVKKVLGLKKIKVPVKTKEFDPITNKEIETETGEFETHIVEAVKEIVTKRNPTFDPIDVFACYPWPHSANGMDEVYGVITLHKVTRASVYKKMEEGIYKNIEGITPSQKHDLDDQWQWTMEARLNIDGLTDVDLKDTVPRLTLIKYRGKWNWGTEEEPDEHETTLTTIGNKVVIEIRKNQYYDQDKPLLMARLNEIQNELMSVGMIEPLASLQYYLNDVAGQAFDSNYYSLNPIIKYDPGRVVNIASISFAPGAMWALTDPTAIDIIKPPEVAHLAHDIMAVVTEKIQSYPGLQNIPMGGRKAALHIQALQEQYSVPVQQAVEQIEETVMSPWLKKAYCRIQQFLDKEDIVRVTGKNGLKYWRTISPENLTGDYNFYWRGANQTTNLHVKSTQIAQYLGVLAPFIPLLMQQGKMVDIEWLLKEYWSDGMGMKGADKIIFDVNNIPHLDPQMENIIMALGRPVPTSLADNPQEHLQVHQVLLQSQNPEIVQIAQIHIQKHQEDFEKMQKMMQQQIQTQGLQDQSQAESTGEEVQGERGMEGNQAGMARAGGGGR